MMDSEDYEEKRMLEIYQARAQALQIIDGEIEGQGEAKYPNGSIYIGQFSKGKPNGKGKIKFRDGGSYEGEWFNGKIIGNGIFR